MYKTEITLKPTIVYCTIINTHKHINIQRGKMQAFDSVPK